MVLHTPRRLRSTAAPAAPVAPSPSGRWRVLAPLASLIVACSASTSPEAPSSSGLPPPAAALDSAQARAEIVTPSTQGNPFAGATFYVDPSYAAKVQSSARALPELAPTLEKAGAFPTAVWIASLDAVPSVTTTLDDAAAREKQAGQPVVPVFVVYDLPDRDCAAGASTGDLSAAAGGEQRYRTEFIDPIAAAFQAHPNQRIVAILEPDSLANIATNLSLPRCAAAEPLYRRSVAYAIRTLARPNVSVYLDAAHAGWLGWSRNRGAIVRIFSEVLADAGGPDAIRGFATNVSNYDTLRSGDLAKLEPSDPAAGELAYVRLLDESLTAAGITGKGFVIDTSRNGRSGIRTKSGSWCNVKGAGLGERPRANPAPLVDAYLWVKPPGESDGDASPGDPGFDRHCDAAQSPDSAPGAPPAGAWFQSYFVALARNANPPL